MKFGGGRLCIVDSGLVSQRPPVYFLFYASCFLSLTSWLSLLLCIVNLHAHYALEHLVRGVKVV